MPLFTTKFIALFLLIPALVFPLACKKDSDNGDAPALPQQGSFVMDFSDFPQNSTKGLSESPNVNLSNFQYAGSHVLVWNIILTINLAVPVATFVEAFNHEPEFKDGTWTWNYSKRVGLKLYTAELRGTVVDQQVQWEMYVSQENGFSMFNWYSGTSKTDGSSGTWTLRKDPTEPTDYIGIEWRHDTMSNTGDIKYTNIVPGSADNGGYIFYGNNGIDPYDAYYDIYNIADDELVEIEWNRTNKEGRVRNSIDAQFPNWYEWDSNLADK